VFPLIKKLKYSPLGNKPYQGDKKRCPKKRDPKTHILPAEKFTYGISREGPYHIKGTMSHIGDPQDPQDEAQARGDDEKYNRPA
jgi:hypothetical protein